MVAEELQLLFLNCLLVQRKGKMSQDDSTPPGAPGIPEGQACELLPNYRALMLARY